MHHFLTLSLALGLGVFLGAAIENITPNDCRGIVTGAVIATVSGLLLAGMYLA